MLLGNRTTFPKSRLWTFVRANQTFANANSPWPIDTARTYASMATATAQDFVGCKLGDVNDSWNVGIARPAVGAPAAGLRFGAAAGQPLHLTATLLPNGTDAHALQTTLTWDPAVLRLRTATASTSGVVLGQVDYVAGHLPLVWTDASTADHSRQALALAELVFDLVSSAASVTGTTEVRFTDDQVPTVAADNALQPLAINPATLVLPLGQRVTGLAAETAVNFSLFPNPAHETVRLTCAGATAATLRDAMGRVVRTIALTEGAATLDVRDLPAGVYFVSTGATTRRLVVE
jgi:hypothetical protein